MLTINDLWIRYIFWKDMKDFTRANYYMQRIKEEENKINK